MAGVRPPEIARFEKCTEEAVKDYFETAQVLIKGGDVDLMLEAEEFSEIWKEFAKMTDFKLGKRTGATFSWKRS